MESYIILTAVGRDQPGIVAKVSGVLFETGCNIEDSSMTQLRGEFAMILIVRLPQGGDQQGLLDKLKGVEKELGLTVNVRSLAREEPETTAGGEESLWMITVLGGDKPGIVHRVTSALADHRINITDVNTKIIGEEENPIYAMALEVLVPPGIDDLEKLMQEIGKELEVDISARQIEEYQF